MSRLIRLPLIFVILASALSTVPVKANNQILTDGIDCGSLGGDLTQLDGSEVCIIMPPVWNGDLVVFAHGYVFYDPYETVGIPWDQLVLQDGTNIPYLITSMHFAFAVTSYEKAGLAVKEGVKDILALANYFKETYTANHVYLVGVSEGGLITTLAVEQNPDVFSGGLAACGPIGDFTKQINYWGDFRVVLDYFFPNLLKSQGGSAVDIPLSVMTGWESTYVPAITAALLDPSNASKVAQLLKVTGAPIDAADKVNSTIETVNGILSYNVLATNEAIQELGGQPFNNKYRWYFGSTNDFKLNIQVARFAADAAALSEIKANYQTSGFLKVPLVSIHDTGDPIVPYWHEILYRIKTLLAHSATNYINIPIARYGHCQFTATEALASFYLMIIKASLNSIQAADIMPELPPEVDHQQFEQIISDYSGQTWHQVYLPLIQ